MLNKEEIIKRSKEIHGNKYIYDLVDYKNTRIKIKIICPEHGIFEQLPSGHIYSKQGCPYCYGNKKMTKEEFIEKSKIIHSDKYDYSLVDYKNNFTKVKIICKKHGIFEQKPNGHLIQKSGCLKCGGKENKTTKDFIQQSKNVHGNMITVWLIIDQLILKLKLYAKNMEYLNKIQIYI